MSGGFGSFLAGIAATVTKRAMVGVGLGVVSFAAINAALTAALNAAKAAWAGLGADVLAFLAIGGVPSFMSIVAGGLVAAAAIVGLKQFEVR